MNKKKGISPEVVVTAIICLALLELVALSMGINGTLLKLTLVIIAGLAGWTLPSWIKK